MPKSDHKYFNCSEEHEINYVASLYNESEEVKVFINSKCADGTINNWTHEELYEELKKEGFTRKSS